MVCDKQYVDAIIVSFVFVLSPAQIQMGHADKIKQQNKPLTHAHTTIGGQGGARVEEDKHSLVDPVAIDFGENNARTRC